MLPILLVLLAQTPEDPGSLQRALNEAVHAKKTSVVLPPGVYRLPPPSSPWCLLVHDAQDLEIDAKGVELVLLDRHKGALQFLRCRNVRLNGLTLRHESPPFTQGRIDAVGDRILEVTIHDGYPADLDNPDAFVPRPAGYVFDAKTRQWKAGTMDLEPERLERIGERRFRLLLQQKADRVEVGDLVAFRGRGMPDLHLGACSAMSIDDVTVRHGSGFVLHEDGGDGGNRYRYTVTFGPAPQGASEAPLLSCNADAFHSSGVRRGPTLDGCSFEGMADDGIAIHGAYALVVESRDQSIVTTEGVLREGDPIRLFTPDGAPDREARVVGLRRLDFTPSAQSRFRGFSDLSKARYVEVTTEPRVTAGFDWLASNPATIGSGYVLRNNVIRNHRARGILLKAENGLVEGNTIEGSTTAAIVLAPELLWREACYSRNVVIRNNTIRRCGTATAGPWTPQAGVLTVTAEVNPGTIPGHRNIVIENNRFEDNCGINLLLQSVDGARVEGNQFEQPGRLASRRGSGLKMDPGSLIWIANSRNVAFEENVVANPGPGMTRLVGVGPEVRDLGGLETGVQRR
jgi:hypothetical protein